MLMVSKYQYKQIHFTHCKLSPSASVDFLSDSVCPFCSLKQCQAVLKNYWNLTKKNLQGGSVTSSTHQQQTQTKLTRNPWRSNVFGVDGSQVGPNGWTWWADIGRLGGVLCFCEYGKVWRFIFLLQFFFSTEVWIGLIFIHEHKVFYIEVWIYRFLYFSTDFWTSMTIQQVFWCFLVLCLFSLRWAQDCGYPEVPWYDMVIWAMWPWEILLWWFADLGGFLSSLNGTQLVRRDQTMQMYSNVEGFPINSAFLWWQCNDSWLLANKTIYLATVTTQLFFETLAPKTWRKSCWT